MDMTGEERIAAPREAVWKALNDTEVLKACIPGCESLERISDTELEATVGVKLGPVKARFNGKVELSNLNPPLSYTITGEGKGGIAGFAKGGADVTLIEEGGETVLTYTVNADVGGKIAQLGSRLISSSAKKLATQFFENLNQAAAGT
ncbi:MULTISPECIES: SRPBCC family protein [unclassified Phyllobacterium]|nr:carbon monoxide dehydrogenase subunit G [Phyllobacterium sp.]MBQ9349894.1 carbon monoxide dehydrogenase subunit G [Phyllobacterium sp.]